MDPHNIKDESENEEEEDEGEDLFNNNYMDDYRRMDEQDHYESLDPDDSTENERVLDQIVADHRHSQALPLIAGCPNFSTTKVCHLLMFGFFF